ncbi:hypothetical protein QTP86_010873 [Hemibagrus guttatus]|nr:hypothetical protein QTP86_010873 [Hemibagrus guttatus]
MESIPTGERVVIGADFNGHVGEGNTGDEEVMGKFVVDFAKRMDMGVVNTYFQKREEHRVTYKSGGRRTQVDYILCRRGNLKEISDCKVVVGESVARQHRMVVCRMTLMVCKTKRSKIEKKTKWWKLKKEECCEEFRQKLRQALGGQVVLPDDWETTAEVIRETGRKVLGVSSGRRKEDKETWWWNEEVQDSIQRKRLAKKKWDMDRTEENRQEYKELQRRVKRKVSKAKQKAYEELYTRLDTREGEKDLYRLARQRDRDGKDVQQVRVIKDRDGRVLTSEESVQRRWKEYFEELMNEENEREKRVEGVNSVEQKVDKIRKDEVRKALKRMKSGKAVGPDDIPVEVWKCLGEAAVEFLANLFNRVLESERMPEEWRRSVLVPIFKNKGDVQSCSNYRGIKLMSHTMKVWERVVEARLRKVVEICEQQYGFMPRKSTTDAIFALRILMEKYRDGQRELHCVFVDLEKVYDRVPREELWYCMRKSGVVEKYVRVVQDMYERSRTVVRCAVGQTEEFNVEVGLHQGSALSRSMMFADDIVICSESREQVEENLERWRFALERRGMKVSGSKTEYMCVNEREGSGTVRLRGEEVKKVQEFKYLGSTVQSNGECGKEVKKRVQAGWNGCRKVSGVLCDQKISARIKGKVYRTVVRAAMLYGLETVSLRKRQESELEVILNSLFFNYDLKKAVEEPRFHNQLNYTELEENFEKLAQEEMEVRDGDDGEHEWLLGPRLERRKSRMKKSYIICLVFITVIILTIVLIQLKKKNNISDHCYSKAADAGKCSEIGRDMLKRGGSAVDAAFAALLCLGLFNAHSMGIGGGHYFILYNSSKGGLSIVVPGELRGYELAHRRHGRLPWRELFEPSIQLARDGIRVSRALAESMRFKPQTIQDDPVLWLMLSANHLMLYANLFLVLGDDPGGIITLEDLSAYTPVLNENPLKINVGEYMMHFPDAPSSGPVLALILNIVKEFLNSYANCLLATQSSLAILAGGDRDLRYELHSDLEG